MQQLFSSGPFLLRVPGFIFCFCVLAVSGAAFQVSHDDANEIHEFHRHLTHYNQGTGSLRAQMLASNSRSASLTGAPPYVVLSSESARKPGNELFATQVCKADAIITGTVDSIKGLLSADESTVFTDYRVLPNQIIANKTATRLMPGVAVYVTQPGGTLHVDGGIITVSGGAYPPSLYPTRSYLLLLQSLPNGKSFKMLGGDSTYFNDNGGHPRAVAETFRQDAINSFLFSLSWDSLKTYTEQAFNRCSPTPAPRSPWRRQS